MVTKERLKLNTTSKLIANEMTEILLNDNYIVRIEKSSDKELKDSNEQNKYNITAYKKRENINPKGNTENVSNVDSGSQKYNSELSNEVTMEGRPRTGLTIKPLENECEMLFEDEEESNKEVILIMV